MSSKGPNLKSYLDKTISLHLNKNRKVSGTLRGYDQYMNVVLSDSVDESTNTKGSKAEDMGMIVVRGSSILQFELIK